ncbi:cytochrome b/b6 domain-containing protein [Mucilaginibacter sp. KACC 22063]|uniref:cytochrome b/b6 domain-containing protein n=1 Tax=Mucilaginibacter sp. KACC 22063 TaxID=3025666 RepID=UPI00236663CA|nr:cytochrome b/b6 domain-containing protein [Mucilaginibacter sp. KACC 22063]WDF54091.1 cytochrome b/b6 domain-containing protein [Mucilaginibacter sp. KACC 22063]
MKRIIEKHPLAIRWFHWFNFPLLAIMIWSGLLIYWAYDPYAIKLFGTQVFKFFPQWFYNKLNINHRLAEGMAFHFVFMWLFFINGFAYVLYTLLSGEWRYLLPDKHSWKEAWLVVLHDLHLRKTAPEQLKYNAAQRIAYSAIVIFGIGSLLTGLSIYKPAQLNWLVWCFGGYRTARLIHFTLTIGYCLFFVVHIVQVILAGWNNFRAMITGFEVIETADTPTATVEPLNPEPVPVILPVAETVTETTNPSHEKGK